MNIDIQAFLDFIDTGDIEILERTSRYIIIRRNDMCLQYQPDATTGQFGHGHDIDIFDYEDYLEDKEPNI